MKDKLFEQVINRENIFNGKYLNLEKLLINLPDGNTAVREIVKVRNAVAVLLIDNKNNVHLVRQHRPAIGKTIIEVPAGVRDNNETAEECARRECREETGFIPEKLTKLITYAHAEGYSNGFITLFLGRDLKDTGKTEFDETEFMEQVCVPFNRLLDMVKSNKVIDSKTIICTILSNEIINLCPVGTKGVL